MVTRSSFSFSFFWVIHYQRSNAPLKLSISPRVRIISWSLSTIYQIVMLLRCSSRVCSQKTTSLIKKKKKKKILGFQWFKNSPEFREFLPFCLLFNAIIPTVVLFLLLFPTICWIFCQFINCWAFLCLCWTFQSIIDIEFYLLIIHSQNYSSLVYIYQCSSRFQKWSFQDNWYITVRFIV